jgi:hypothetical protein
MTTLASLPDLNTVYSSAVESASTALASNQPDMFDNLWVKLANITGNPTPAPTTTAAPAIAAAPSSPTTNPAAAPASSPSSRGVLGNLAQLEQWAADLVTRQPDQGGGLSLEDLVFIVLGVLLIAAAVFSFVFTFNQTQQVVKSGVKAARGAVDAKVAAALAA